MTKTTEMATRARDWLRSPEGFQYLRQWSEATARACDRSGINLAQPEQSTDLVVLGFFQFLWEALPDRGEIRTPGFFQVCDFAEHYCFGMGEEEEKEGDGPTE